MTGEDTAGYEDLVCPAVVYEVCRTVNAHYTLSKSWNVEYIFNKGLSFERALMLYKITALFSILH